MHFMWEKRHIKGLVHKKRTYISLDHWYDSYDFFILEGKGVSEYHRIRTSSWYASPPLSHYKSWLEISMEFGVQKNSYRVLISSLTSAFLSTTTPLPPLIGVLVGIICAWYISK